MTSRSGTSCVVSRVSSHFQPLAVLVGLTLAWALPLTNASMDAAAAAGQEQGYAHPEALVDTAWLNAHLDDADVRVLDTRRNGYDEGHIPGALRFDQEITRDATNPPTFLPSAESLARSIGDLGISSTTRVVFYDDVGGVLGTRAWVVLRHYGHSRVSILNGGWLTWMAEGRDVSIETPEVTPATFRPAVSRSWIATAEDVLSAIDDPETNIIDTRTAGEMDGSDLRGVARGGHIPSAIGIHWEDTLETQQRSFKPAEELRELFQGRGVDVDDPAILYRAVGARASHELFVMHLKRPRFSWTPI